jgi:hypothetical protein
VWLQKTLNPDASILDNRYVKQYDQHIYALDILENGARIPGPKFVYAHLTTTHQPFVFNPDGSMIWPIDETKDTYLSQIEYTNQRILEIVKRLIQESRTPPIIILQGDHSYAPDHARVKILNAYYLPGKSAAIYPTITPVNTFRVIFDQYFAYHLGLKPDRSYYLDKKNGNTLLELPGSCIK